MKSRLVNLLEEAQFAEIVEIAAGNKRVLSLLSAQTYHADNLIGWRAVQVFGMAAQRIAEGGAQGDVEYVRNHLRRQFWLVNDESGGIGWRAPELIGETLRRCPGRFEEFVSPLVYLLDIEEEDSPRFRAGALWAIGRIAPDRPPVALLALPLVLPCLQDADPRARGMALWCLGCIGYRETIPGLASLQADFSSVEIYEDGDLRTTTVAELTNFLVS